MSRGPSKLWVTLRSASIFKTCLARVFPLQHLELICLCLAFHGFSVLQKHQRDPGKGRCVWDSSSAQQTKARHHNLLVLVG